MSSNKKIILATGEIYHLINHSIGEEEIFIGVNVVNRILETINYYRYFQKLRLSQFKLLPNLVKQNYLVEISKQEPLVDIYVYSLMPNHFHFLVKQQAKNGIMRFISNTQNSFAKYFNQIKKRRGSVFITSFKAKRIETEEQFIHVSRYIHINHVTDYLLTFDQLKTSKLTSFPYYCQKDTQSFINSEKIIGIFQTRDYYIKFVRNQIDYQRKLAKIKKLLLE